MAKLVDMDGDGTPELYCGAGLDGQHMYSYADGKIYALNIPEGVSNFGTDVSPCADFYVDGTDVYKRQQFIFVGAVYYNALKNCAALLCRALRR